MSVDGVKALIRIRKIVINADQRSSSSLDIPHDLAYIIPYIINTGWSGGV